jgi:glioma pathogenesis-related protein 2
MRFLFYLISIIGAVSVSRPGIDYQNYFRRIHHSPPLVYDQNITNIAQKYANYLSSNNLFQHGMLYDNNGNRLGQNLMAVWNTKLNNSEIIKMAVRNWYQENIYYNYSNPGFNTKTGHFTQVVWKSSKKIGFGIARNGTKVVVVADYFPAGNVNNQFRQNVFPK